MAEKPACMRRWLSQVALTMPRTLWRRSERGRGRPRLKDPDIAPTLPCAKTHYYTPPRKRCQHLSGNAPIR